MSMSSCVLCIYVYVGGGGRGGWWLDGLVGGFCLSCVCNWSSDVPSMVSFSLEIDDFQDCFTLLSSSLVCIINTARLDLCSLHK